MDSPEVGDERPVDYPPPPMPRAAGRTEVLVGFVFAAAGIIIPLLGVGALISGYLANRKGNPMGRRVIAAGVAAIAIGMALALVVQSNAEDALALVR